MLHKEFWGLLFLGFVAWIFISASPSERIDHFCRPIQWSGSVATSISALIVPSQQKNVQMWFDKFDYGCEYMTWRLIYQADYNKAIGAASAGQATAEDAQAKKPAEGATVAPAGTAVSAEKSEK